MKIKELAENYSPSEIYLHGGPEKLEGGNLKRGAKRGSDMGALFFVKESAAGYKYALGYAISRVRGPSGVYRVKINLSSADVFDFTNHNHRAIAGKLLSHREFQSWENSKGDSGHINWAAINEEIIKKIGFKGTIIHERDSGKIGSKSITSVAVFDPQDVEIIEFVPKQQALKRSA